MSSRSPIATHRPRVEKAVPLVWVRAKDGPLQCYDAVAIAGHPVLAKLSPQIVEAIERGDLERLELAQPPAPIAAAQGNAPSAPAEKFAVDPTEVLQTAPPPFVAATADSELPPCLDRNRPQTDPIAKPELVEPTSDIDRERAALTEHLRRNPKIQRGDQKRPREDTAWLWYHTHWPNRSFNHFRSKVWDKVIEDIGPEIGRSGERGRPGRKADDPQKD